MPVSGGAVRLIRRLLLWLAAALALLVVLTGATYAAWPWLLAMFTPWLGGFIGLDQLQLQMSRPGLSAATVQHLELTRGGVRVQARGGELRYRLIDLAGGRLELVRFEQMTLQIAARTAPAGESAAGQVERLFAALPTERLEVALLQVAVPALEFRAQGHLRLTAGALDAHLVGMAPARAHGLELAARLTRDGLIDIQLGDGGAAPFLRATSAVGAERLEVAGDLNLHGFAFDLLAELASLPPGQGSVSGRFAAALPWPLPEPVNWLAVTADGVLEAEWRHVDGRYGLHAAAAEWRLAGGALSGTGSAELHHGGSALGLRGVVESFHPGSGAARGRLTVDPPAPGAEPHATFAWELAPAELRLDGAYSLDEALLARIQELAGGPPGQGLLAGQLSARLPWPLPQPLNPLAFAAHGSVRGSWRWQQQDAELDDLEGTWQLADRQLTGAWRGHLRYGRLAAPLRLSLHSPDLAAAPLAIAGEVAVGELGSAPFAFSRDPLSGAGALSAQADLLVGAPLAAGLVADWSNRYDIRAGRLRIAADLRWQQLAQLSGSVAVGLDDVSAHFHDYLAEGVQGLLQFEVDGGDWALQPSTLRARAVELGFTLGQVESGIAWARDTVSVQATTATVLGGHGRVAAFDYHIPSGEAYVTVELQDLDLAEILALEGDQVAGTGRLDAVLPLTVVANAPSISGGWVRAHPPGGRLQVSPALAAGTGQPGLDFALRALQNFDYVVLQGDVSYTEQGDLALGVQLQGRNPDVEDGRPIRYNLTVTENLPILLQSLRLQDEVTRGLERRLNR